MNTVNILGTPYTVTVKKYDEEESFERCSSTGFCDGHAKEIIICDMKTYKGWEHEPAKSCEIMQKECLRHEIVHAFFNESGLMDSSFQNCGPWSVNEEMVDWIALQGPKIHEAWKEAGAL